jgi:hypothetical protein
VAKPIGSACLNTLCEDFISVETRSNTVNSYMLIKDNNSSQTVKLIPVTPVNSGDTLPNSRPFVNNFIRGIPGMPYLKSVTK